MFHGFDGLITLSRREGVDIRPTLLRVLTDLYVQTPSHSADEEKQFSELALRLISEVDDATRAAVRARLAIYPRIPRAIAAKLALPHPELARVKGQIAAPAVMSEHAPRAAKSVRETSVRETANKPVMAAAEAALASVAQAPSLAMQPRDASALNAMFLAADAQERAQILHAVEHAPLKASMRADPRRAARALPVLEAAAMKGDRDGFASELADALILPVRATYDLMEESGGEYLACALKALGMPGEAFQRVLMFLDPKLGQSVMDVYRLSRLYETLSERSVLIMLAAWRGASVAATKAKYRPGLYDDERQRARHSALTQPVVQPGVQWPQTKPSRNTG